MHTLLLLLQLPPNGLVVYTGMVMTEEGKEKKVRRTLCAVGCADSCVMATSNSIASGVPHQQGAAGFNTAAAAAAATTRQQQPCGQPASSAASWFL
jgi:hypothetical protein